MRRELEWIRKQPKARTTKAKYRVDAFEAVKAAATVQKKEELQALALEMTRVWWQNSRNYGAGVSHLAAENLYTTSNTNSSRATALALSGATVQASQLF
jgi:uncharacterized protein YaiL (DUF2058 family)